MILAQDSYYSKHMIIPVIEIIILDYWVYNQKIPYIKCSLNTF